MSRTAAIIHIWELSMSVDGEFCCGKEEHDALEKETTEALIALGVTEDEQNAALETRTER